MYLKDNLIGHPAHTLVQPLDLSFTPVGTLLILLSSTKVKRSTAILPQKSLQQETTGEFLLFIFQIYFSDLFSQVLAILLHRKDSRIPASQSTPECLLFAMDPLPQLQLANLLQPTSTQREESTGVALIDTDSDYHLHSCFSKPASHYHVLIRFIHLHPKLPLSSCFPEIMLLFHYNFSY